MNSKIVPVSDLPLYTPWPARLLGIEPWAPRKKIMSEILREFDKEQWGELLSRVRQTGGAVTLDQVGRWEAEEAYDNLCVFEDGHFEVLPAHEVNSHYTKVLFDCLEPYAKGASGLVELGAGYGRVILSLAAFKSFKEKKLFAGELTKSGRELISVLAKNHHLEVAVGACDLNENPMTNLALPLDSAIFTSMSMMYVPQIQSSLIDQFIKFKPKVVVHFEPCYEHYNSQDLLGLMRRRYMQVNDYNTNLVSVLKGYETEGKLKILSERRMVFGNNPMMPLSLLVWSPS